jgi:hypothetical protein
MFTTLSNFMAMLVIATSAFAFSNQNSTSNHESLLSRSRLRNIARHRSHALAERQVANGGFAYVGCVTYGPARVLTGGNTWAADMTVDDCVTRCDAGGFTYAGLQSESLLV